MTCADLSPARRCDRHPLPVELVHRAWATLGCWRRRAVERRQLAQLPRERWADIARDPETIRREIAKPFWQP
jgi:uncharacterized protein YjiS (DUF1127 family)